MSQDIKLHTGRMIQLKVPPLSFENLIQALKEVVEKALIDPKIVDVLTHTELLELNTLIFVKESEYFASFSQVSPQQPNTAKYRV